MDKKRAIQIITNAAKLYHENLEDQKVLFMYGAPSEIRKQIHTDDKVLSAMMSYEVVFHRSNYLHLTGVRLSGDDEYKEECNNDWGFYGQRTKALF